MRTFSVSCALIAFFVVGGSYGLDCWRCVGPDCDGPLDQSEFADVQTCEQGAQCQKTYFYYRNANTALIVKSIAVRSCSYSIGCDPIIDMAECMSSNEKFQGLGCIQRYCCDTNLCNT